MKRFKQSKNSSFVASSRHLWVMRVSMVILMSCQINLSYAQTSLDKIALDQGPYTVGFSHYLTADSTRTYSRIYDYSNKKIARPIPISIWYPSNEQLSNSKALKVIDYFQILKEEEEWEQLPDEQLLNWFYYANTSENQAHLTEPTNAYSEVEFAEGNFPVVVYAPSYQAASIENFALCETLASQGYIVIASPSRGTETRWFSNNNAKEMETQARDVEFLIKELGKFTMADRANLAVMGFSFGGLANVIAQMRNDRIKAVVSLDGTERYLYSLLKQSAFFDLDKFDVPYIHFSQKEIPEQVLKEDAIDPTLNTEFKLFDSLTANQAYKLKFHKLTHSYFSTLGVLFQQRDNRQDKSDAEIMESYKWLMVYVLNFLDAYLKEDQKALKLLNKPTNNQLKSDLISQEIKLQPNKTFTFQDFNELAIDQQYNKLFDLYNKLKQQHPSLELPEGNLNTLGLQLVFDPETDQQGIAVLIFATQLYPHSANLFDSLAEAYLHLDNKEQAIANFEKSLQLNAQNQNAINRLKQLKK